MVVKKDPRLRPPGRWDAKRQRGARASLRLHADLRRAIEFIAEADRRTLSQSLEFMVLDHVRQTLQNNFDSQGKLVESKSFEFKPGKDPRK